MQVSNAVLSRLILRFNLPAPKEMWWHASLTQEQVTWSFLLRQTIWRSRRIALKEDTFRSWKLRILTRKNHFCIPSLTQSERNPRKTISKYFIQDIVVIFLVGTHSIMPMDHILGYPYRTQILSWVERVWHECDPVEEARIASVLPGPSASHPSE